jgi:hypothetical protein
MKLRFTGAMKTLLARASSRPRCYEARAGQRRPNCGRQGARVERTDGTPRRRSGACTMPSATACGLVEDGQDVTAKAGYTENLTGLV